MDKRPVLALLLALCGTAAFAQNLPRVVLVPLENRVGAQYAYDIETLGELLVSFINETRRVNVIDRLAIDVVMSAWGWQRDDLVDNAKAIQIGKALNAQYIVRGTVSRLGDNLLVSTRVLNIHTAELRSATNTQMESMNDAYSKMNNMAQILIYNMGLGAQPVQQEQSPADQATSTVFVMGATIGTLEIHTITAGTVEISGISINQTVQMPAWSSLAPVTVSPGRYRVVMKYDDGKLEEKWVDVKQSRTAKLKFNYRPPERLNTLGLSVGNAFMEGSTGYDWQPIGFNGTIRGTYAPRSGSFFELGMDIGLSGVWIEDYFSLHPFIRYACFLPFAKAAAGGGWYIGVGVGFFFDTFTDTWQEIVSGNSYDYVSKEGKVTTTAFTVNVSTGFVFRGGFTLSLGGFCGLGSQKGRGENVYYWKNDGDRLVYGGKLAIGYSYRFKNK